MKDADARREMREVAACYERLAQQVEQLSGEADKAKATSDGRYERMRFQRPWASVTVMSMISFFDGPAFPLFEV